MADRVETPEQLVRRLMKDAGVTEPEQDKYLAGVELKLPEPSKLPKPTGPLTHVWLDEAHHLKQHQFDALEYLMRGQAQAQARVHRTATVREKTLRDFSSADLVMEMLSRGFAVMKLPEDGGAPEVLKNG